MAYNTGITKAMSCNHISFNCKRIPIYTPGIARTYKKTEPFFSFVALVLTIFCSSPSLSVEPNEVMRNQALEARAREISKGLRCVVCQNQSIDDSNAGLARDMRLLVRKRIIAGDSDAQVTDYLVSRYGDYILLNPPLKRATYVLWFGPLIIVALGLLIIFIFFKRSKRTVVGTPRALTESEHRRVETMLKDE